MHICQSPEFIQRLAFVLDKFSRHKKNLIRQRWVGETFALIRACEQCWRKFIQMAIPVLGHNFLHVDPRHESHMCIRKEEIQDAFHKPETTMQENHLLHCVYCIGVLALDLNHSERTRIGC